MNSLFTESKLKVFCVNKFYLQASNNSQPEEIKVLLLRIANPMYSTKVLPQKLNELVKLNRK